MTSTKIQGCQVQDESPKEHTSRVSQLELQLVQLQNEKEQLTRPVSPRGDRIMSKLESQVGEILSGVAQDAARSLPSTWRWTPTPDPAPDSVPGLSGAGPLAAGAPRAELRGPVDAGRAWQILREELRGPMDAGR